jgi:aminoglycoside 6'-N-acetyltransferase I
MYILPLTADNEAALHQAAEILTLAFREHWPDSWTTLDEALQEVHEMLAPDRICRAACDADGNVLGWIGGIPEYDGNVWELHPLAVHPAHQRRGLGRALVADFEAQVRSRGGLTIMLGSDDVDAMTTLAGVDLYDNLWQRLANIRNLKGHPYEFYQKLGYTLIGVMPDANGRGKPDIYMGKRV